MDTVTIQGRSQPFPSHTCTLWARTIQQWSPWPWHTHTRTHARTSLFTGTSRPSKKCHLSTRWAPMTLFWIQKWPNHNGDILQQMCDEQNFCLTGQQTPAHNTLCTQYSLSFHMGKELFGLQYQ
jgi:hypothetical protein